MYHQGTITKPQKGMAFGSIMGSQAQDTHNTIIITRGQSKTRSPGEMMEQIWSKLKQAHCAMGATKHRARLIQICNSKLQLDYLNRRGDSAKPAVIDSRIVEQMRCKQLCT